MLVGGYRQIGEGQGTDGGGIWNGCLGLAIKIQTLAPVLATTKNGLRPKP